MSNKSKCCNAPVEIESDYSEGTSFYRCTKCQQPCDVAADAPPERRTKPYRTHLLERLQMPEDRVEYLRAVFEDGDSATINKAVQDVCDSVNFCCAPDVASRSIDAPEQITAHYDPATGFAVTPSKELAQAFQNVEYVRADLAAPTAPAHSEDAAEICARMAEQDAHEILQRGAEIGRLDNEIIGYREEIKRLRTRLFATSCREGSFNHSTACSIWGDDGQGNTVDFGNSLPCNCGALINFYKASAAPAGQGEAAILDRAMIEHPHVGYVDGIFGGITPIVGGIRIGAHDIMTYLFQGNTIPEISNTYGLTDEQIKDAIAYVQDVYYAVLDGSQSLGGGSVRECKDRRKRF